MSRGPSWPAVPLTSGWRVAFWLAVAASVCAGSGGAPDGAGFRHDGTMNNLAGKKLQRPREGRLIAGVAAGFGEYFEVDPVVIRVLFAAAAFFGGAGIGAYLLAWILIPEEGESSSIADRLLGKTGG
jgi:phage shock protein PspC (stress-responsive transcriptional regulator)